MGKGPEKAGHTHTHTHIQKIKRTCILAQTEESLVSRFQMLLHEDKLILKCWRHEKYYSKFNSFNAAPFNLFYCLKGGKGMFLTVCETRNSVRLMLMGILWPEPTLEDVCAHFSLGFTCFHKKAQWNERIPEETAFSFKTIVWNIAPAQPSRIWNIWITLYMLFYMELLTTFLNTLNFQVLLKE